MSSCSVCRRGLGEGEEIMATRCGHRFHTHCINFCINRFHKCPDCEADISQADIHRVYLDPPNRAESNPPRNDGSVNEQLLRQNEIMLQLLRQMQSNNSRDHSESNRRPDNRRPGWGDEDAQRNAGALVNHGTIINCDVYRPVDVNFSLSIVPPQMPFLGSLATPAISSRAAPLALPDIVRR